MKCVTCDNDAHFLWKAECALCAECSNKALLHWVIFNTIMSDEVALPDVTVPAADRLTTVGTDNFSCASPDDAKAPAVPMPPTVAAGATKVSDGGEIGSLPSGESDPSVTPDCPPSECNPEGSGANGPTAAPASGVAVEPRSEHEHEPIFVPLRFRLTKRRVS